MMPPAPVLCGQWASSLGTWQKEKSSFLGINDGWLVKLTHGPAALSGCRENDKASPDLSLLSELCEVDLLL